MHVSRIAYAQIPTIDILLNIINFIIVLQLSAFISNIKLIIPLRKYFILLLY
jgi:hypothetical protein